MKKKKKKKKRGAESARNRNRWIEHEVCVFFAFLLFG